MDRWIAVSGTQAHGHDEALFLRIAGFYAAGDMAKGLDQISHAIGEAGVAATTIRNDLAKKRRLFR